MALMHTSESPAQAVVRTESSIGNSGPRLGRKIISTHKQMMIFFTKLVACSLVCYHAILVHTTSLAELFLLLSIAQYVSSADFAWFSAVIRTIRPRCSQQNSKFLTNWNTKCILCFVITFLLFPIAFSFVFFGLTSV